MDGQATERKVTRSDSSNLKPPPAVAYTPFNDPSVVGPVDEEISRANSALGRGRHGPGDLRSAAFARRLDP